jgi:hypothetical protein
MIARPISSIYFLMFRYYQKKLLKYLFLEQIVIIRIHLNFFKLFKKYTALETIFVFSQSCAGTIKKIIYINSMSYNSLGSWYDSCFSVVFGEDNSWDIVLLQRF